MRTLDSFYNFLNMSKFFQNKKFNIFNEKKTKLASCLVYRKAHLSLLLKGRANCWGNFQPLVLEKASLGLRRAQRGDRVVL